MRCRVVYTLEETRSLDDMNGGHIGLRQGSSRNGVRSNAVTCQDGTERAVKARAFARRDGLMRYAKYVRW